jgi:hypothetical protein
MEKIKMNNSSACFNTINDLNSENVKHSLVLEAASIYNEIKKLENKKDENIEILKKIVSLYYKLSEVFVIAESVLNFNDFSERVNIHLNNLGILNKVFEEKRFNKNDKN